MKNLKVKLKLVLAFTIVAIIVAISGVTGIVGLNTMNNNEDRMYKQSVTANNCTLARRNIQAQRAASRGAALKHLLNMEYESEFATVESLNADFNDLFASLDAGLTLPENRERLAVVATAYAEYLALRDPFMTAIRENDIDTLTKVLLEIAVPIETVVTNLEDISESAIEVIDGTNKEDSKTASLLIILLSSLVVISVVIAMFFAFYISGLISKPIVLLTGFMKKAGSTGDITLRQEDVENIAKYSKVRDEIGQCISSTASFINRITEVSSRLETVAGGDLTIDLPLLSDRDTMGLSLHKMVENLNDMFGDINAASAQVSTGSKQIADGAQSLAQGSTEQASAIEELSVSIGEIAGKTSKNATIAREAADLSNTIKRNAEKGNVQMDQMMQAVKEINDASGQIEKVIKVIDDIAFQTNILALNAAVEAARAGEHGKGFAVVAEEVRSLAAKSAEAAKDTGGLIENSIDKANFGLNIAIETSSSLKEIVDGINHSAGIILQIAQSSEEQSAAVEQINIGIDQVAQVVQQNSATAQESAAASEEMTGQAEMLSQLISNFKLKDDNSAPALPSQSNARRKNRSLPDKGSYSQFDNADFGKY